MGPLFWILYQRICCFVFNAFPTEMNPFLKISTRTYNQTSFLQTSWQKLLIIDANIASISFFLHRSNLARDRIVSFFNYLMWFIHCAWVKCLILYFSIDCTSTLLPSYRYRDYQTGTLLCRRRIRFQTGDLHSGIKGQDRLRRDLAN